MTDLRFLPGHTAVSAAVEEGRMHVKVVSSVEVVVETEVRVDEDTKINFWSLKIEYKR